MEGGKVPFTLCVTSLVKLEITNDMIFDEEQYEYCKTGYFRGHVIFAVGRFCRTADFNFRGCRYGAF